MKTATNQRQIRARGYAAKFRAEEETDQSDANLERVFRNCVRPAPRSLYPLIRIELANWDES